MNRVDNTVSNITLLLHAYSLLQECVDWSVAYKWPLFIRISHSHCIATTVHATICLLKLILYSVNLDIFTSFIIITRIEFNCIYFPKCTQPQKLPWLCMNLKIINITDLFLLFILCHCQYLNYTGLTDVMTDELERIWKKQSFPNWGTLWAENYENP
jgi:hypothetical protein